MSMTEREKLEFRESLLNKISDEEENIRDLELLVKPVSPDDAYGRISRMDAINNKAVIENSLRMAKSKLSGLRSALERIDDEDFGICTNCKQKLALQRLLFRPESIYCMSCAR